MSKTEVSAAIDLNDVKKFILPRRLFCEVEIDSARFNKIKINLYISITNSIIKVGQCKLFNTINISVIGVVNDKKYKQETELSAVSMSVIPS